MPPECDTNLQSAWNIIMQPQTWDIWIISTFALIAISILMIVAIVLLVITLLLLFKKWYRLLSDNHMLKVQLRKMRENKDELEDNYTKLNEEYNETKAMLKRIERARENQE